jgi:heme/copper-type cytochrome/quinol oxidase subunit 3
MVNKNSSTSKIILTHPYHLVDPSPWPFFMAIAAFNTAFGLVVYMHRYDGAGFQLTLGLLNVLIIMFFWWRDVIREATYEGMHTKPVQRNLKIGFALFILSEVMFFFGFFWAYFHSSLAPTIFIGSVWPPVGIEPINPFGVPLLNTFILLTSGVTLTMAHHAILHGYYKLAVRSIAVTLFYAIFFTVEQFFEYLHASFNINDGIYGSTFYMLTGFHGFHVIVGTVFIAVCLVRLIFGHFTSTHHVGFESAVWYWHFVDVVWLALYVSVYWWGAA